MSSWKLVRKTRIVEYRWEGISPSTGVRPDIVVNPLNDPIDVENADSITIQIDTRHNNNTSTDIDINVLAILKAVTAQIRDTTPYAERNSGDTTVKTFLVEPGPDYITLTLDNNDSGSVAWVTVIVFTRYLIFVAVEDEE